MTFATEKTMEVQERMAKDFPSALPPTVKPATKADIPKLTKFPLVRSKLVIICAAMVAAAAPETTPQMSPMTSLQIEATRSACRSSIIHSLAPGTFFAAMEWNGLSSAEVTATPMMSNTMPKRTMINKIRKATAIPERAIKLEDVKEMVPETAMVVKKMRITQRRLDLLFFRSCFAGG